LNEDVCNAEDAVADFEQKLTRLLCGEEKFLKPLLDASDRLGIVGDVLLESLDCELGIIPARPALPVSKKSSAGSGESVTKLDNPSLDAKVIGYDTYCPQCGKYYLPDNVTVVGEVRAHRPAIVEVSYGQMVEHLHGEGVIGVDHEVAATFRSLYESDDRNHGYTLVSEDDQLATTLMIQELVWRDSAEPLGISAATLGADEEQHHAVNAPVIDSGDAMKTTPAKGGPDKSTDESDVC
jgi:hypothetical protein